ncbi:hypothetical protein C7S18_16825 [Ahniella affigens]|uniref:Uncharacterized protein n=1 Tax=Ahniella affigens TaxID=2021234 RepID=A0A2P1PV79_9GAMM|nr:hypothetical protein C7S18_16825 [Ahniella affigens]
MGEPEQRQARTEGKSGEGKSRHALIHGTEREASPDTHQFMAPKNKRDQTLRLAAGFQVSNLARLWASPDTHQFVAPQKKRKQSFRLAAGFQVSNLARL